MFPLRHVKTINTSFQLAHSMSQGSATHAEEMASYHLRIHEQTDAYDWLVLL